MLGLLSKVVSMLACNPWGRWSYPLCISHDSERLCNLSKVSPQGQKAGIWILGLPVPKAYTPLVFIPPTLFLQKVWRKCRTKSTQTPLQHHHFAYSLLIFSHSPWPFLIRRNMLRLDVNMRICEDLWAIWHPPRERWRLGVPAWMWGLAPSNAGVQTHLYCLISCICQATDTCMKIVSRSVVSNSLCDPAGL